MAHLTVKENHIEELIILFKDLVQRTRQEKGCLQMELYQNKNQPSEFVFVSEFVDVKAFELHEEPIHLDEQIAYLREQISSAKRLHFTTMIPALKTRLRIIVTFMAILEMLRTNQIGVEQDDPFGEIILTGITV